MARSSPTSPASSRRAGPQNQFAIVLDGDVVSDPFVQQALTGGSAEISGGFDQTEAQSLANMLKYGSLPLDSRSRASPR